MRNKVACLWFFLVGFLIQLQGAPAETIDLLQRYPTKLTGAGESEEARQWEFTEKDIFRLSRFEFGVGNVRVSTGRAELGIGHCSDGAVWAVIVPKENGALTSPRANETETIAHIWLRFHPKEIRRLFLPETISASAETNLLWPMRAIANAKIGSSWQAGGLALIPGAKDMTLDVDVTNGLRRFFVLDTQARIAEYIPAFEHRAVHLPPSLTTEAAASAFDQMWEAFDSKYAMFVLRARS